MSLIAWYPLHKDLNDWSGEDRGVLTVGSGCSEDTEGPTGGSYRFDGTTAAYLRLPSQLTLSRYNATVCFFIKKDTTQAMHYFGKASGNGTISYIGDDGDHFIGETDSNCNQINTDGGTLSLNANQWYHIALTFKDSKCRWYVDGVALPEQSHYGTVNCSGSVVYEMVADTSMRYLGGGGYDINLLGNMSDFRIYDHALSARDLRELSLAKVAHFGFNGDNEFLPRNITRNPTFIPGDSYTNSTWDTELNKNAISCSSWSSGYNSGVPFPESGYHAKWVEQDGQAVMMHINDNGQFGLTSRWLGISSGHGNLDDLGIAVGDRICLSWLQRSSKAGASYNVGFYTRKADGSTKWESGKITHTHNVAGEWERKTYTTTVGTDTDVTRSITVYFYGQYSVEGAHMEAKDIQFEKLRDIPNPYREYSTEDVVISDSTGLGNDAILELEYAPVYVKGDSGKGSNHFHFPTTERTSWNDIRRRILTSANHMSRQVTASIWARTSQGDNRNPLMKYDDGIYTEGSQVSGGAILLCLEGNRFRMHGWGSSDPICQTHTNDNEWHHYVWTFDYDTRLANMYVDGVREVANSLDSEGVIQPLENYVWTIGANNHPYASTTGNTFNGDIAEATVFGKALTPDEVKTLYSSRASIDDHGHFTASEFVEGWDKDGALEFEIRSSSSGNTGTFIDGVKQGYQSSSRGISFCIYDESMTLRGYGSLDTYSGTTTQYYEFDGTVYVGSANDIADSSQEAHNWLIHAMDNMEDGWLMTAARCDASTAQNGQLRETFLKYFGVTENHAITSRGTWGFMGIKNGELLTQFSDGRRYNADTGSIAYYTNSMRVTGDYHTTGVTSDGVVHAGELFETNFEPSLLDYSTWVIGDDGGFGTSDPLENLITVKKNPWGDHDVVWQGMTRGTNGSDGGWYGKSVAIDSTKHYRYTNWIQREVTGNGSWYLGCSGSQTENLSGTANTNPYFVSTSSLPNGNEWFLVVAYLYAAGTTDTDTYTDYGIYNVKGEKIGDITKNYRSKAGSTSNTHRSFLHYSTDVNTIQNYHRPRVEVMDGNQPSIAELCAGSEHTPIVSCYNTLGEYENNATRMKSDGSTNTFEFNEV
ncbi:virion structural protein [Vibrio phage D480]